MILPIWFCLYSNFQNLFFLKTLEMASLCGMSHEEVLAVQKAWKAVMETDISEHGANALLRLFHLFKSTDSFN